MRKWSRDAWFRLWMAAVWVGVVGLCLVGFWLIWHWQETTADVERDRLVACAESDDVVGCLEAVIP